MPDKLRTLLVTNPGSRSGDNGLEAVRKRLEASGPVRFRQPEEPSGLPTLIRECGSEVDRIVLGGGDGTINLALDAVLESDLPLGILPLGTANDLARSLEIPSDIDGALDVILAGRTRRIDVGRANDVSFINAIGMGLGPRMTRQMDGEIKANYGVFAYLIGVARALRGEKHFDAVLRTDKVEHRHACLQITVANGIHYGGGMTIAYDAKLDDGLLDAIMVRRQGRLSLLRDALRLRSGDTHAADTITHVRCSALTIETESPLEVTADGEFLTSTPVTCSSRPGVLTVYAPHHHEG
jgi:diacylglycerol kinase (ATP)